MQVAICGYAGSGKTTVFNALSGMESKVRAGVSKRRIEVPDHRVNLLAEIFRPGKTIQAEVVVSDGGAGTRGAQKGLGPEMIRMMIGSDALAHVIKAFDGEGCWERAEIRRRGFEEEMILRDLGIVENRVQRLLKMGKRGYESEFYARVERHMSSGLPLRLLDLARQEEELLRGVGLLSRKPIISLFNVAEEGAESTSTGRSDQRGDLGSIELIMSGAVEEEIASMPGDSQEELRELFRRPARDDFIKTSYMLLDLISFFTVGSDEVRAWSIKRGTCALEAAGKVHSDIQRGFIRAEVYEVPDLLKHRSLAALRKAGKMRLCGKDYRVKDGDVINFRFNV